MTEYDPALLVAPRQTVRETLCFRITPSHSKTFNTVLDAAQMVDPSREMKVTVDTHAQGAGGEAQLALDMVVPIRGGEITESLTCRNERDRLVWTSLTRTVKGGGGQVIRREEVHIGDPALPLPECSYPEVALPFLLRFQPSDKHTRNVYAWMNDRFVARVKYEVAGKGRLSGPTGSHEANEVIMYPDFNDWVKLGTMLTKLAWPFVPKYRMWFSVEAPHRVLRYEGPYGPPGAPEIVLELVRVE